MNGLQYKSPIKHISIEDCFFYHTMPIPGIGLVQGQWDLRAMVQEYLGNVNFSGKRVFEIGPASGFLTFYMESLGAEVIGCELPVGEVWDFVPYSRVDLKSYSDSRNELHRRLINGFWFAHQAHKSKSGIVYTSTYEIPSEIGVFDIATFSMVLLHLRDPFLALKTVLNHISKTIIITEMFPWAVMSQNIQQVFCAKTERIPSVKDFHEVVPDSIVSIISKELSKLPPQMFFCPRWGNSAPKDTWWQFTPNLLQEFIGILGFETEKILYHYQLHDPQYQWSKPLIGEDIKKTFHPCFTIVGQRMT
jgi:hypothetical protein